MIARGVRFEGVAFIMFSLCCGEPLLPACPLPTILDSRLRVVLSVAAPAVSCAPVHCLCAGNVLKGEGFPPETASEIYGAAQLNST